MVYFDSDLSNFLIKKFSFLTSYERTALTFRFEDECGDMYDDYFDYVKDVIGADWYATGCTKSVWHFEEFPDVVIKIPFVGYGCIENYLWSNHIVGITEAISNRFIDFDDIELNDFNFYTYTKANNRLMYECDNDNYCGAEAYVFEEAVKAGVDKAFAFTKYLMAINDVLFYVSECVDNIDSHARTNNEKIRYSAECLKNEHKYTRLDDADLENIIIDYGFSFAQKLLNFLDEWDVDDLGYSNLGASDEGEFKIIDYASYREEE